MFEDLYDDSEKSSFTNEDVVNKLKTLSKQKAPAVSNNDKNNQSKKAVNINKSSAPKKPANNLVSNMGGTDKRKVKRSSKSNSSSSDSLGDWADLVDSSSSGYSGSAADSYSGSYSGASGSSSLYGSSSSYVGSTGNSNARNNNGVISGGNGGSNIGDKGNKGVSGFGNAASRNVLSNLPELWGIDLVCIIITIIAVVLVLTNIEAIMLAIATFIYKAITTLSGIVITIGIICIIWLMIRRRLRF